MYIFLYFKCKALMNILYNKRYKNFTIIIIIIIIIIIYA